MNIIDLLRGKNIEPNKVSSAKGGEYHSPCPGCGGEDRFHVWPEQNQGRGSWWCRGCGKGGDGIQFLREFFGLSFRDACKQLGLENKISAGQRRSLWKTTPVLPRREKENTLKLRENGNIAAAWGLQAEKLLQQAKNDLQADPAALDHLGKTRGIIPETARRFRLGLLRFPGGKNCRFSSRKKWDLPPKDGGKKPDALWIPRGLLIPGFNAAGEVVRLRIRRPVADHQAGGPKYYLLPGSSVDPCLIYNKQPVVVVVEAELDAFLMAQEAGELAGVLAMGSSAPRPTSAIHDILQRVKLILLAFDADEAGQEAVERWRQWYDHAYSLPIPAGHKDPGEAWQAGVDLRAWIRGELPAAWVDDGPVKSPAAEPMGNSTESAAAESTPATQDILVDGVPVLGVMPGRVPEEKFYLVKSRREKLALSQVGKVGFLPDEVRRAGDMPHELFRAFLDFSKVFPGVELLSMRVSSG